MGPEAPDECPQCHAPKSKFFEKVEQPAGGKIVWADEHKVGVAQGLDAEVVQGLRENFAGECTEVGMYLAMSRQADREGFPEVAEAYKRIAFEEAEHAAKFAELLGEVVYADTKKNLELRVAAEAGATEGKLRNSATMPSMTRFMKCARTKLATALHSRACSVVTSSNKLFVT